MMLQSELAAERARSRALDESRHGRRTSLHVKERSNWRSRQGREKHVYTTCIGVVRHS